MMFGRYWYSWAILVFGILVTQASTQQDNLRQLTKNLSQFNYYYPQEKVYLHFDNNAYFLEESLFFNAYVVMADCHRADSLSGVLYVELLAPDGQLQEKLKLKIVDGQAAGSFRFHPNWKSGYYEVRAYTRSMLNWDESTVFSRIFPVFDSPQEEGDYRQLVMSDKNFPPTKPFREAYQSEASTEVYFYPEGGNLIQGLSSQVAYKVLDRYGMGKHSQLYLCDAFGQIIDSTTTQHNGMGVVTICPQATPLYLKMIEDGQSSFFPLPPALAQGYSLSCRWRDDALDIELRSSTQMPTEILGISILARGRLLHADCIMPDKQGKHLCFPDSLFADGVNQITLFDAYGQICAERFVFKYPEHQNKISIVAPKSPIKPFEKISLQINVQNTAPNTSLSIAIRDSESELDMQPNADLASYLLLASDLKGYIECPSYYLEKDDAEHRLACDLLMMVHGWRRYDWSQMSGMKPFKPEFMAEKHLSCYGRLVENKDGLLLRASDMTSIPNTEIGILVKDKSNILYRSNVLSDENGCYGFEVNDFYGQKNMMLYAKDYLQSNKKLEFLIDRHYDIAPRTIYQAEMDYSLKEIIKASNEKISLMDVQQLKSVGVTEKRKDLKFKRYDVEKYREKAYDLGLKVCDNLADFLKEHDYQIDKDDRGLSINHLLIKIGYSKNYSTVNFDNVRMIDVYESPYAHTQIFKNNNEYQPRTTVIFLPFKENTPRQGTHQATRNTIIEGFSRPREFHHINYQDKKIQIGDVDYRRTLYWNPNVTLDENGHAEIEFFNNSTCRHLSISAEGLSHDGKPLVFKK